MTTIRDPAEAFFDACETGKGWAGCAPFCHDGLEAYTEWMKNLLTPLPDGTAEVRSFAVDDKRNNVTAYGVFRGTHTGEGGPVPPTGKGAAADYVYVMDFDGDKISHMTKIWNDGQTMRQLGWA